MGQTVKQATQPIAQAAKKAVEGVKDVASGNIAKGIGEVGGAYVDGLKATVGVSADNKLNLGAVAKTGLAEFSANPQGFLAGGVEAFATGGASLLPSVGSSILSGMQGASPGQLSTGRAPMIQAENEPIYVGGASGIDLTMPVLLIGGAVLLFMFIRRK